MWRKSWSWKEMSLKYLYFTQYLFLFMTSSPRTWQIWVHSLKLCIGLITLNFCYLADDETPILIKFSSNMYWSIHIWRDVNILYFCYLADDEAPILNCPNISSTTDEGLNSSSTVLLNSTATDNVDYHLDVTCSHSSEDIFLIGDTTVNCSSTDAAGNTNTCLLVVTVTGVNMIICYV